MNQYIAKKTSGLSYALVSVLLITVAQLSMKWGMSQLSESWGDLQPLLFTGEPFAALMHSLSSCLAVALGLACYALSMACWVIALKHLALALAYPLLSLSYVLVYFAAILLPWFNEDFSWQRGLGVAFILLGVTVIFSRHRR